MCAAATADHGPYSAFVKADAIEFYDDGWCFDSIGEAPIGSLAPFSFATAPARDQWRHVVYNSGVWLFAEPALP